MAETNWVEQLARIDKTLIDQTPDVWAAVRSALEDSCKSYNDHYVKADLDKVAYLPENGNRIRIKFRVHETDRSTPGELLVRFDETAPCIEVTGDVHTRKMIIKADSDRAFVGIGDRVLTADEVAQLILEPALFKPGQRRKLVKA